MPEILVEITRGARVESRHAGSAVVVDETGAVVFQVGDIDAPIYPRSAVKALLALPLIETGAADRLGLTEAEIALACSSHSGEPIHVLTATTMLAKAGRDAACLECGVQWPANAGAAHALAASGGTATALHNNCSGKHAGFICLACDRAEDPAGYIRPEHPTMREITVALADMTSTRLDDANIAVDGCSIPTYAIPLRALARAFARFGAAADMPAGRASATRRIRAAVAANPMLVAGTGRFDTRIMQALGPRVFSKGGAEGAYCAAIPELGYGIAVKCDDGAGRAAQIATAALIGHFLAVADEPVVADLTRPSLTNWNGVEIGTARPAGALLF